MSHKRMKQTTSFNTVNVIEMFDINPGLCHPEIHHFFVMQYSDEANVFRTHTLGTHTQHIYEHVRKQQCKMYIFTFGRMDIERII